MLTTPVAPRLMTPRVALLACSFLVFLLETPSAAAAPSSSSIPVHVSVHDAAPSHQGDASAENDGLTRTKRQLIGTPSLPLMMDQKRKRPFCNAFTGCGRKRSEGGGGDRLGSEAATMGEDEEFQDDDRQAAQETMGTLVELNSEPAVAELSRQILSEAKLWEAIQEARQEIARRRQQQAMMMAYQQQGGQQRRMAPVDERHPRALRDVGVRKRRGALSPPPIPKGTLPSAGYGALPIV